MMNFLHSLAKSWRVLIVTIRIFGKIDGEQRAASFAYYALFSLFPLFALLLTVGSSLLGYQDVITFIQGFLPLDGKQQDMVWKAVNNLEQARGGVSLISILILLWCSLKFFQALVRGVNRAWHTIEIPWWQMPLRNLIMLAVLGSALLLGLLAPAILQGLRDAFVATEYFMTEHFPMLKLHDISGILNLIRFGMATAVLFYAMSLLYMIAPRKRVRFSQIWGPALLATISLQICQNAFVNYLPRFVHYNAIYGTVGGLMLLLLWVYLSGIVIIFCGCLCAALDRIK